MQETYMSRQNLLWKLTRYCENLPRPAPGSVSGLFDFQGSSPISSKTREKLSTNEIRRLFVFSFARLQLKKWAMP